MNWLLTVVPALSLQHVAIILLLYSLYRLYVFWTRYRHLANVINKIPGPKEVPLVGNALQFLKHEEHDYFMLMLDFARQYNGIFRIWLSTYPLVCVGSVNVAEKLLSGSKHLSKSSDYKFLQPWLGTGLLTSNGEQWKARRKLITPTFHFKILNNFIGIMEEHSKTLISQWKDECTGGPFDVTPFIKRFTLDVICEAAMGVPVNAQQDQNSTYAKTVTRISSLISKRGKSPWMWPSILFNLSPTGREHNRCLEILHGFTDKVINERIAERKQYHAMNSSSGETTTTTPKGQRQRLAFLDLLIEAHESGQISRDGIREEVDTFMFEGHDTTASGLTWLFYLVGAHPHVQHKARQEVDRFFETHPGKINFEDLENLSYLECVIKESLRLFPPVPFIARNLTEDNNLGQRFALLEEKIALAYILHSFSVESVQEIADLKPLSELVMRPKDGLIIKLHPRAKKE